MTIDDMAFTPTDGLKNTTSFPTSPSSEAAARKQIQDVLDQLQAYLNNTLTPGVNTHLTEKVTDDVHGISSYLGKFATFGRTAAQNLANATDTVIVWQTITNSNGAAFCEIDGSGKIKFLEKGVYELTANFQYASNATGIRTVDMTSAVAKTVFQAINGTGYLSAHGFAQFNAGDLLTIQAYQSSGAALDLQFQNTRVRIRQVAKLP